MDTVQTLFKILLLLARALDRPIKCVCVCVCARARARVCWGWERERVGSLQVPAMSMGAKKEETYRTRVDPIQSQHDEIGGVTLRRQGP